MTLLRSISFSLLLHALVAGWFLIGLFRSPSPENESPVVVEFEAPPQQTSSSPRGESQRKVAAKPAQPQPHETLSLKDLGVHWERGATRGLVPSEVIEAAKEGAFDRGGKDGVLGKLKYERVYRSLYAQMNSALLYPSELFERGIEGNVKARVVLAADGHFLRDKSHVSASSKYLKVLVYRLLRRVFSPGTSNHLGKEIVLHCDFEFRVRSEEGFLPNRTSPEREVLGNEFYFARAAKRAGQWKLGPISGYYFIPAVAINPEEVVDEIKRIGKVEKDPLEDYRNDPDYGVD